MREISTTTTNILNSGIINAILKVVWVDPNTLAETVIPNVISINVTSDVNQFSNNAAITIKNVNPDDPSDSGFFNSQRNDSSHLKPANAWSGILVPNRRIKIYAGYETNNLVSIFYGFIDDVQQVATCSVPTLVLTCRDTAKKLMDQNVNCLINGVLQWGMAYPPPEGCDVFYIANGIESIDLDGVVYDICNRAGIEGNLIAVLPSGVNLTDVEDGELLFGDFTSDNPIDETWDSAINRIRDLTMFDFWTNEDGMVSFKSPYKDTLNSVYTFQEGVNIFELPLERNHDGIYGTIRVIGNEVEATVPISADSKLYDGSYVFPKKLKTVGDTKLQTVAQCLALANRLVFNMREQYNKVNMKVIPLPHLQIGDQIKIVHYGMMNDYYIVKGQVFNWDFSTGLTHTISVVHYTYMAG